MLRKVCKSDPSQKSRLMNAIFMMSSSKSPSVLFECANTITQLTTAPSAIKVAIQSYLNLLQENNDNNVKVIVLENSDFSLEKILQLRKNYTKVLEDYITDILAIIKEWHAFNAEVRPIFSSFLRVLSCYVGILRDLSSVCWPPHLASAGQRMLLLFVSLCLAWSFRVLFGVPVSAENLEPLVPGLLEYVHIYFIIYDSSPRTLGS